VKSDAALAAEIARKVHGVAAEGGGRDLLVRAHADLVRYFEAEGGRGSSSCRTWSAARSSSRSADRGRAAKSTTWSLASRPVARTASPRVSSANVLAELRRAARKGTAPRSRSRSSR